MNGSRNITIAEARAILRQAQAAKTAAWIRRGIMGDTRKRYRRRLTSKERAVETAERLLGLRP